MKATLHYRGRVGESRDLLRTASLYELQALQRQSEGELSGTVVDYIPPHATAQQITLYVLSRLPSLPLSDSWLFDTSD